MAVGAMTTSLLIAKLSLMVVLATYLPLFLGVRRGRRPLAAVLVAATAALFAFSGLALGDTVDMGTLIADRAAIIAGGAVALIAVIAALTWLAWRFPAWALPAVVAVMPLRIPLPLGDRSAYLLLPLYAGILAILIAEVVIRDRLRPPSGPTREAVAAGRLPSAFDRPLDPLRLSLAAFIALAGLSVFWAGSGWGADALGAAWRSEVFGAGLIEMMAFLLPFGIVTMLTFRYVADGDGLRRVLLTVIGSGVVLAVIGIVQYPTRWLVFNRSGIMDDYELGNGFRVNSLFWDPNMFSRFLIVALLLSIGLMVAVPLWRRRLAAAAFLLAGANLLTLSRSGWMAFAVGFIVFAFAWLGRRRGAAVAGAAVLVLLLAGGLLLAARGVSVTRAKLEKPWGINKLTGGRLYLGEAALKMTADRPAGGVGYGAFSLAYPDYRNRHASKRLTESHTTPLTLLAEVGVPGLLVFLAVVWAAFDTAFRRRRLPGLETAPARAGPADSGPAARDDARRLYLIRAALGAVVAAVLVHSLLYNAFFEDPYLWLTFGLSLATAYRLSGWRPYDVRH
jgi:O-antigen ligase